MSNSSGFDRRRFLTTIPGIAFGCALPVASRSDCDLRNQDNASSLRAIGAARGVSVGAAVSSAQLAGDADFVRTLLPHCSMIVPEWEMKWTNIYKERGRADYAGTDAIADFARKRCLRMRGHPLVWHAAMPGWAVEAIKDGAALPLMESHIQTTMSRYRDIAVSWDVVNEAIRPEDGHPSGLRNSLWLQSLGPQYIEKAFRLARATDANARLVYNDYNVEYEEPKAQAVLSLVMGLRDRGVPIDAVGLQSHLWTSRRQLRLATLKNFCRTLARERIDVVITEFDVRESDYASSEHERDSKVADVARRYLETVFAELVPREFTFWGLSDRYSWLSKPRFNPENPRGHLNRGLLFDKDLQPKQILKVVSDAIASLPAGKESSK